MDSIIDKQRAAFLLLKEKTLGLNAQEEEALRRWRQKDAANEETYLRLQNKDFSEDMEQYEEIDVDGGWKSYRQKYRRQEKRLHPRWWRGAIAVVMVAGIVSLLYLLEQNRPQGLPPIKPGSAKAILVLNNGETIELSGNQNKRHILTTDHVSVQSSGEELTYSSPEKGKTEHKIVQYNELIIPKGGEFALVLSDGTRVWVNSQSKLRYPVVFGDSIRDLYLEGEAYFEVAKDSTRPFQIDAGKGVKVEVLGTSFNVRSYTDEKEVTTVLEEGRVSMSRGEKRVLLRPGQRGTWSLQDSLWVDRVNTELYTAWRTGQYVFMEERLEDILNQLARWYDIEVFYNNESVKELKLSGDVERYDDINTFLEGMEIIGGLHFEMKGKTLIVSRKQ